MTYAKNPNNKWYCYNDSSCKVRDTVTPDNHLTPDDHLTPDTFSRVGGDSAEWAVLQ